MSLRSLRRSLSGAGLLAAGGLLAACKIVPLRFEPIADAEVAAAAAGTNYGSAATFGSDGDPERSAYLRFQVSGVKGAVTKAVLRCYVVNGSTNGPSVYRANTGWSESSVTWGNQPGATGSAVATSGAVEPNTWLEFDVSSVVKGNGSYDFVLRADSTDSVECRSREAASNRPELIVTSVEASDPTPPGYTLYWRDEFDGPLDTQVWTPYHNTYGDGNKELQCLTPNNVYTRDGALHIVARRENVTCPNGSQRRFTSGFIGTREKGVYFPRFARYEMRAKLPHMHGLWPAFWLRHRDGAPTTEVDVMEYFHAQLPGKTSATLHYNQTYNVAKGSSAFEAPTLAPGWHVWAAELEQVSGKVCLKYFVDDKMVQFNGMSAGQAYCFTDVGPFARYPNQGLFDIAINMAVGGNWVGDPDGPLDRLMNGTPVSPTNVQPTSFPTEYVVDYVRVYTR
jgi:hypothetical protein